MVFVADNQNEGTFGCFMVLGSDISTAAGCYHVFGSTITIRALLVGPIMVNVTCQKWIFVG